MTKDSLRIGVIFPEVLGTYGDGGNALVLQTRARLRGYAATIEQISVGDPIPAELDIYTLGGGEDTAQALVEEHVKPGTGLYRAVAAGRPLLAICAGLQVLGEWYEDAEGRKISGLGMLDCTTIPQGKRTIGELVSKPLIPGLTELLTGFENHGGATRLGPDAKPLGVVQAGRGNGAEMGSANRLIDGAVQGSVIATYMHGPALARNPQLADLLLARALGAELAELPPLVMPEVEALRRERLQASL